ncbi:LysE family translocator [Synechococcus sp. PCC 7336]|uniref:LysE family translocator n=1 Tax=Synechococcus sp. PCC 7336 TaxID=195250 RepID=UPI000367CEE5|nr:LysE family translocator [Synechococcus sp. PCC 7336]
MEISMTFGNAAALFGAMFVLATIPGPSVFTVVARTIASGFSHGLTTVLGIVVGDLIFIILAVLGLWSFSEMMSGLFVLIKYCGSAYLIWLGIELWRSKSQSVKIHKVAESSWLSNFLCGLLITLGDPKAILFYLSFLPAFLDLSSVSILDTGIIMVIAAIAVGGAKLGYAYMSDKSRLLLTSPRTKKGMNVTAGSVMIGTGVFLVTKT